MGVHQKIIKASDYLYGIQIYTATAGTLWQCCRCGSKKKHANIYFLYSINFVSLVATLELTTHEKKEAHIPFAELSFLPN